MSVAKEISVFFRRNHRHIPYMHLILRNETRFIAFEIKMDVNQELSFSLARKREAKFLLMPSLADPAYILQRFALKCMTLANDSNIKPIHAMLLNRVQ